MTEYCVTDCENLKCRYNKNGVGTDGFATFRKDRPAMGCEGYKPKKTAKKPTGKRSVRKSTKSVENVTKRRAAGTRRKT